MKRLATGGRIDRSQPLTFKFNGQELTGFAGDTLASALLANGVRIVGHSVERGRPRGIYEAGAEEPNAYVQLEIDGSSEPLVRATEVELFDGLVADSANGKGRVSDGADPLRYYTTFAHCDVLVIGGGPAGLSAALEAGRSDARVMLVDDGPEPGGALLNDRSVDEWVAACAAELSALPEVRVLNKATAFGAHRRGSDGRIDPRQDRRSGAGRSRVSEPHVRQHV